MEEEYLTVAEVAELLKLNPQTLRNWVDAGTLPAVRIGRRVRIRRSTLEEFIAAGETSNSAHEPIDEADAADGAGEVTALPAAADERLAGALAESTAALAGDDREKLVRALSSLADAAGDLAAALQADTQRQRAEASG